RPRDRALPPTAGRSSGRTASKVRRSVIGWDRDQLVEAGNQIPALRGTFTRASGWLKSFVGGQRRSSTVGFARLVFRFHFLQQLFVVFPVFEDGQRCGLAQPLAVRLLLEQPVGVAVAQYLDGAPGVQVGHVLALFGQQFLIPRGRPRRHAIQAGQGELHLR